jgi:hypothetical protein
VVCFRGTAASYIEEATTACEVLYCQQFCFDFANSQAFISFLALSHCPLNLDYQLIFDTTTETSSAPTF